jgi:Protein of unknown function (DUF5132)
MAFFEEMFKGNLGSGLAVGIGVTVVAPLLAPVIGGVMRPLAKTLIKAGLLAVDAGLEGLARLNETAGDMVAEARAELDQAAARRGPQGL